MNENLESILSKLQDINGYKIKKFRNSHNITQQEFANKIMVSQSAVSAWERTGIIDLPVSIVSRIVLTYPDILEGIEEEQMLEEPDKEV